MQELATGYGLVEGPVWDAAKGLYFSDVLGGGIHLLDRKDKVSLAVPKRRGVGGMALHADGGIVAGGRDIVHISLADHSMKVLFDQKSADDGVGFNDLTTDAKGRGAQARQPLCHRRRWQGPAHRRRRPADQRPGLLARRPAALPFRRPARARSRL
jgi:hypothetical protein